MSDLPISHNFEKNAGPYLIIALDFAFNREIGYQNVSIHRLLKVDDEHFAIRMVEGRHLHRACNVAKEAGEDLHIAVVIGAHPAVEMAAACQAPYGHDELMIANNLLRGFLKMVLLENDLYVSDVSEIVIIGSISKERVTSESMVEMLGNCGAVRKQPLLEVHKIYHRKKAIDRDTPSCLSVALYDMKQNRCICDL